MARKLKRDEIAEKPLMSAGLDSFKVVESGRVELFFDGLEFSVEGSARGLELGQTVELWADNMMQTVRGIAVGGRVYFYLTREQEAERHRRWVEQQHREDLKRWKKSLPKLERRYRKLPEVLRKRMDRLRADDPKGRPQWESYELFVLEEAAMIAGRLRTPEKVKELMNSGSKWTVLPELDKGHSPNTLGCAMRLAYRMARGDRNV